MKTKLFVLITLACITGQGNLMAQRITFPATDSPTSVTAREAADMATDMIATTGFGSAYFQKSDLLELIDVRNCVGIRFYVAMENPKQRFADVIGVAINEEGKEIGDFLERKYHLAKALDAHYPSEYQKMNRSSAKRCIDILTNGTRNVQPYAAYLGATSIKTLLNEANSTGIRIYAAEISESGNNYRSMAFGSVESTGKEVNDVGTNPTYLRSNLPCPVDCGDERQLLRILRP